MANKKIQKTLTLEFQIASYSERYSKSILETKRMTIYYDGITELNIHSIIHIASFCNPFEINGEIVSCTFIGIEDVIKAIRNILADPRSKGYTDRGISFLYKNTYKED